MNLKITDLLDEYLDEMLPIDPVPVPDTRRIKEAAMKKIEHKKVRPLQIVLIAAAVVVLLTGTVLGVMHYTKSADSLEENWNYMGSTEMTSEHKDFIEQRSADIGESVTDQGITVTIESVTCTTDMAYVTYTIALDPEVYDLADIETCADALTPIYVENPEYGTVRSNGGGGSGDLMENGVTNREMHTEFYDLPEGASLGDGKTTMHMEMNEMWIDSDTENAVNGTWNFAFLLPKGETETGKRSEEVLNFDSGVTLEVSAISVDASSCKFSVAIETDDYHFTAGGEAAALARAAEPDALAFTVDAKMEDGSLIPSDGGGMSYNEKTGLDDWSIRWAAPLDPQNIVSLIFSDGETEIEIPLDQ